MAGHVAATIAGLAALAATASLAAAALRLPSWPSFALAVYVLAVGSVVLLTEVLSLSRSVQVGGYLAGQAVLLAAVAAAWNARGRPRPPALPAIDLRTALRRHPVVAFLAATVAVGLVYEAAIALLTPATSGDALTYHLARAAAWRQQQGLQYVPGTHSERVNEFPANAEMQILYTFVLLGRDTLAVLPQLLAQAAAVVAVYGLGRRLRASRAAAAFAALLFPAMSIVALNTVTPYNDVCVAALIAACAYFVIGGRSIEIGLAALALALALGTKLSAFFALPALALLALVSLRGAGRIARATAALAVAFLAFGSYVYVQNVVETGRVAGAGEGVDRFRAKITPIDVGSNVARNLYHFIDFSGFRVDPDLLEPVERAGEAVYDALRIPTARSEVRGYTFTFDVNLTAYEDASFFGPLGVLLVLPLSAGFAAAWAVRRATPLQGVLALSFPLYLLAAAMSVDYQGYGRYFITPVALVLPLAASLYRWRALAAAIAALAALTLFSAHAYSTTKPTGLGGTTPVWKLSRSEAQGLLRGGLADVLETIEARVRPDGRLGIVAGEADFVYPLYGEELERRLVPLSRSAPLTAAEQLEVDVVYLAFGVPAPDPRPGWEIRRYGELATIAWRRPDA